MKDEIIKNVGEFASIRHITHDFINRSDMIVVPSGDDGAVYKASPHMDQVISIDTMVEGIHFTSKTMKPSDVGFKLCTSNVSDIVAMGGNPTGIVISTALPPELSLSWLESCYDGIREACKLYHMNILGGDVTRSIKGVILTGTVVGEVPSNTAVTRKGAAPGDLVCVTGSLGSSGVGLVALQKGWQDEFPESVIKHQRPKPSPNMARLLREHRASSMNDISDGLSSELNEIAVTSQVTLYIEAEQIPFSDEVEKMAERMSVNPIHFPLTGGEDYELVFTIASKQWDAIKHLPVHQIGIVKEGQGQVILTYQGKEQILTPKGYSHF